ncbi:hypothetical protein D3C72_784070 [compost metagenome]
MNDLSSALIKQLLVICIDFAVLISVFLFGLDRTFFNNIAEGDQFYRFLFGQAWQMFALGNSSTADYCYFQHFRHDYVLLNIY